MSWFATTLTVPVSATPVMQNKLGIKKVVQMLIRVRSMGTATYVAVGGRDEQAVRLTGVGQNIAVDTPTAAKFFDVTSLFVSSDTADAVIEIFGDTYGN